MASLYSLAQPSTKAVTTSVPVAGACCVSGQSAAHAVLPLLGRHGGEAPVHTGLAVGHILVCNGDQGVGGVLSLLEGDDEAHLVSHRAGAGLRGDTPVQEVQSSLNVGIRRGVVHAPEVLGTGAQALILLAIHADVDGQHTQVVVAQILHVIVSPSAVLVEHSLLAHKLSHSVVAGLGSQQGGVTGGIGDVQIPDLLVVVQIGALDGVGGADAVCLVLVVDGQVCQMGLEAPVRRTVHAGRSESTVHAQLSLACLNIVSDLLQIGKALDVVLRVAGGGQQFLVVDDAVGLDDVGDGW